MGRPIQPGAPRLAQAGTCFYIKRLRQGNPFKVLQLLVTGRAYLPLIICGFHLADPSGHPLPSSSRWLEPRLSHRMG